MLGNLIGGFITIIVGVTLVPSVANQVYGASHDWNGSHQLANNVTGASATIVNLTTLFFVLGIMAAGIAIAAQGLRSAGLLGV